MKTHNIIIATITLILLSSLLTGCKLVEKAEPVPVETVQEDAMVQDKTGRPGVPGRPVTPRGEAMTSKPKSTPAEITALVKKAQAVHKDAMLNLDFEINGSEVMVTISIENPSRKPITSVQTWLSYDVNKLKGKSLDTSNSSFQLQAPYDNTFDRVNGLLMLGRSHSEPITDEMITVATVTFELLDEGGATLEAYDYRGDLTGHTSANTVVDGKPFNVLLKPGSPLLIIQEF